MLFYLRRFHDFVLYIAEVEMVVEMKMLCCGLFLLFHEPRFFFYFFFFFVSCASQVKKIKKINKNK